MRKNYFLVLLAIVFTVNGMAQTACNLLAPTVTSSQSYVCMTNGWNNGFNLQAKGAKDQEKYKWYASETDASPIYNDSVYNYTPNRWEDNKLVFEGDTLVKYFWVSIANGTCESPKTKYKIEVIVTPDNFNNWNNNTYCSGDSPFLFLNSNPIQYLPADFQSWQYRYTWRTDVQCNDKSIFESFDNYGNDLRINEGIKLNSGNTINETGKELSTDIYFNLMQGNGFGSKYCNSNGPSNSIRVTVSPSLKLRTTKTTNSSVSMAWDTITPAPTNYTVNYRINQDTTNHKESLKEVYSYTVSNLKKGDTVYFSIIPNGVNCGKTYETIGVAEEKIIPANIPTQNLVGWWPFNGNANDESGYGNHGKLDQWATTKLTKDRFGNENKAYEFGNTSIIVPYSPSLKTTSMTFSGWFKTKNLPTSSWDSKLLITKPNTYGIKIALAPGTPKNCININSNVESGYTSKMEIDTNNWYHFVYVHDEKTGSKLFINGNLENSSSDNGPLKTSFDRIYFGGENNWSNFKGILDDIAIFNKALDSNEVKALYGQTCNPETATLKPFQEPFYTTTSPIKLEATPDNGTFSGAAIEGGSFNPAKAKLGRNAIKYAFTSKEGCSFTNTFSVVVSDTTGSICKKYDTITVTNNITKYDTLVVNVNKTIYDTVKVNTYDTITVTNNVTKYDTVIVPKTVTKYDTVLVNKYDTITITNNVTKYDTVLVNKYDTITVTDTVSILKIKFKLTTGIQANQLASMSVYPNPTSDVLHIEIGDAKALEGYRYRILDALGKEVYNELVKNTLTEIPLKTLGAAGMYQLEVLDANKTSIQTNKIVLQ